jgi:hypothetical protein
MEPVVIACDGCGTAVRIRHPEIAGRRVCPRCKTVLAAPLAPASATVPSLPFDNTFHHPSPGDLSSPDGMAEALSFPRRVSPALVATLALAALVVSWFCLRGFELAAELVANRVVSSSSTVRLAKPPSCTQGPESRSLMEARHAQEGTDREVGAEIELPFPPFNAPIQSIKERAENIEEETSESSIDREAQRSPDPAALPVTRMVPSVSLAPTDHRFKILDENRRPVVARLHGQHGGKTVLILPDGQLGLPTMLVPTTEPFRPLSADELLPQLQEGPLGQFQVLKTQHYLIFYRSTLAFAEASGRLLEDLYKRLLEAFRKHEMDVNDTEFPLVAVIYRTEREFRLSKPVDPEIQAFYEIFTNRIHFYESSERDQNAPEVTALRKPQTVAHEGTHQILQNIGVHPRLSAWPIWLVEGLAEYCATPASNRKQKPMWDGLGMINGLHMATIRELEDPLSIAIHGQAAQGKPLLREPGQPLVESLVRKEQLTPTEYALAWAMTHYLAFKRGDDFIGYLKTMSEIPPLEPRTPEEHLAEFQKAFGQDLAKVDKAIDAYLRKLAKQKTFDPMPYYAVMFEQSLPTGLLRRGMVSQSPQMIQQMVQQWIQEISNPQLSQVNWQALPHGTRARALVAVESWMQGYSFSNN